MALLDETTGNYYKVNLEKRDSFSAVDYTVSPLELRVYANQDHRTNGDTEFQLSKRVAVHHRGAFIAFLAKDFSYNDDISYEDNLVTAAYLFLKTQPTYTSFTDV